jgi:dienelactone hydrolase
MPLILFLLLLAAVPAPAADFKAVVDQQLRVNVLHPGQTTVETQVYAAALTKPASAPADAAIWTRQAARLRADLLSHVVLRGRAAEWSRIPTQVEWLDTIDANGYRIRKFRFQAVPNLWVPGLLYEPAELKGRVPAVLNLNGHESGGMSTPYIQERCINLARKGMLAYNIEWFWKGQLATDGLSHYRINQLDLAGTSGVALLYLAQRRLVDVALTHSHVDPARIAVTGLSGGGWQTIFLSALDPRVALAVPVAGYSSFVTRAQFPNLDLGDSEQAPSDLGAWADYTALTAMLAPRPTLIVGNLHDNCCFRADYAIAPLLVAARPFFELYHHPDRLEYHISYDPGHNYGPGNREALYAFLGRHFFTGQPGFSTAEIPSAADVRQAADLHVPLPDNGDDFHTLALKAYHQLPHPAKPAPAAARQQIRALLRWPEFRTTVESAGQEQAEGLAVSRYRMVAANAFTTPVVVLDPGQATGTTLVFGDAGRAALADDAAALLGHKQRVVALDLFYFGEASVGRRDFLYALQIASLGRRPLGIQAAQLAQAIGWARQRFGPVSLLAVGPRSGVIALAAGALETDSIAGVELVRPLHSLAEVIERNFDVTDAPELFCFGLLEATDLDHWKALLAPRPVIERR